MPGRPLGLNTGMAHALTNSDFTSSNEDPGRGFKNKPCIEQKERENDISCDERPIKRDN